MKPEDIAAQILRKLVKDASEYIGEPIHEAVITVPAYFTPFQRQAIVEAAKTVGLKVVRIINEPTAASLAYGLNLKEEIQTVLVFDMGGSSLDVSILEIGDGVFEVLATSGYPQLGGNDFDREVLNYIVNQVVMSTGFNVRQNKQALRYLMAVVERSKVELSGNLQTEIDLSLLPRIINGLQNLENIILTRNQFEELCSDLISRCKIPVEKAIRDAEIEKSAIDEVILVGGSTRIPAIQKLLEQILKKKLRQTVNPERVVALGAAIQAGVCSGDVKDILLLDITSISLGIEISGGFMYKMFFRNNTIPGKIAKVFSTSKDNQTTMLIHILQGEKEMVRDNFSLGYLVFDGIPPAPRGVPEIIITFDIDANKIFEVTVKDTGTGKEQLLSISNNYTNIRQQQVVPKKHPLPDHPEYFDYRKQKF